MEKMCINGNSYMIGKKKPYVGIAIPPHMLNDVIDFSYEMCFGEGHHRLHRTGGQASRKAGEQFCNTFQGKLAETALRGQLLKNGLECGEIDFNVYGEGIWDDTDIVVNGKSMSVKSAAHFSNLLLLETHDYDENGNYLPNMAVGSTASYDYHVLVRIRPDIKNVFSGNRLLYSNDIPKDKINDIIRSQEWSFDIAGWVSHDEFVYAIRNKFVIPQNALLNGKTKMDAENYYIQSGDMHDIGSLRDTLKR